MSRLESIKERFNKYEFVHSYIDDNCCNQEWDEAHEAMGYLLQRLEIAQKALEEIVHESICKGEDCSFGDTCYAVISKLALDQLKE
jgi:hypothetical protein